METRHHLPPRHEMLDAFEDRDASYEGVFFTGVTTTGIFCRPSCPAKKPLRENVEFFATVRDALFAGYRPCKRCRPMRPAGEAPDWLEPVISEIEADPSRRWTDRDLRSLGLSPDRVRRWFRRHHGMTFHAYARSRRLGAALDSIRRGDKVIDAAFDHGYDSLSGFNEAFSKLLGVPPTRAAESPPAILSRIVTPLGPMVAGVVDDELCFLEFADRRMMERQIRVLRRRIGTGLSPGRTVLADRVGEQLDEYFAGRRRRFELPIRHPGTPFQEAVWRRLRRIEPGETTTYGDLAAEIDRPGAARAVARAVGDNRLAIVVPCHRVVGHDGRLTGYGGGLWRKRRLLEIEGVDVPMDG